MSDGSEDVYDDGCLRIEHNNYFVACAGTAIKLRRIEFFLLSRLARNPNRAVATEELWNCVGKKKRVINKESLRVHIHHLRRRLEPFDIEIKSFINVGYLLATKTKERVHQAPGSHRLAMCWPFMFALEISRAWCG
ncbi:MAG: helix-turn-helix domain-containing protein [Pyrinomonadaceae bacterium]